MKSIILILESFLFVLSAALEYMHLIAAAQVSSSQDRLPKQWYREVELARVGSVINGATPYTLFKTQSFEEFAGGRIVRLFFSKKIDGQSVRPLN